MVIGAITAPQIIIDSLPAIIDNHLATTDNLPAKQKPHQEPTSTEILQAKEELANLPMLPTLCKIRICSR